MSTKLADRSILYFAPALLIAIACVQLFLATTQALTPWKGGGFGMFSTVDTGEARFLRIYLIEQGVETAVVIPDTAPYQRLTTQLRHFPRQHLLDQLTHNLSGEVWAPAEYSSFEQSPLPASGKGALRYRAARPDEPIPASAAVAIQGVRVELWRYQFDGGTGALVARKFMESTKSATGA
jgi:hypothetical protein